MHYLQGCKLLGCECFAISVQLHTLKCISQIPAKDLYYKCHGAVPFISFGCVLMFLNSYRLLIVQKALCIYRSTDCKSWNRLLYILDFPALYFSELLFTVMILDDQRLLIIIFCRFFFFFFKEKRHKLNAELVLVCHSLYSSSNYCRVRKSHK